MPRRKSLQYAALCKSQLNPFGQFSSPLTYHPTSPKELSLVVA